jgi:5-(carboxyamino)imidazole ribonucleotide synthase
MLKSIEDNFEHPDVNQLLKKHFVELKAASPEGSAHVLDISGLRVSSISFWSLWQNTHKDQRLRYSKIPADISEKLFNQSKDWAIQIAEGRKYIGTLCVEFFIDRNENLYVNEIAPRVHNSGHLTINAYNVSQFENHVRAVCSLNQIPISKLSNAEMTNLIGDEIIPYRNNLKVNENQFFFDYLKTEIKEKRKMGHITTLI